MLFAAAHRARLPRDQILRELACDAVDALLAKIEPPLASILSPVDEQRQELMLLAPSYDENVASSGGSHPFRRDPHRLLARHDQCGSLTCDQQPLIARRSLDVAGREPLLMLAQALRGHGGFRSVPFGLCCVCCGFLFELERGRQCAALLPDSCDAPRQCRD